MAFANTYIRISTANYETLPSLQSFLSHRGKVVFPSQAQGNAKGHLEEEEPVELTSENSSIKEAYELKYPGRRLSVIDGDEFEWGVAYEGSTHQILTFPNMTEKEFRAITGAADALGFNTEPVVLAHDEIRTYKATGVLPAM